MMQKSKPITLGDLFSSLGLIGEFEALRSVEIQRLSPVEACGPGDLVFIGEPAYLAKMAEAKPSAFVVGEALWEKASALNLSVPMLRSRDAKLAFAKASGFFCTEKNIEGRHDLAIVHPSALIADTAVLGPHVIVEEGAVIEGGVILHPGVKVGPRSRVGKDSVIFPNVVIYQDVVIGERVRIHANSVIGADGFGYAQERSAKGVKHVKIHHLGGVDIGDDVEIGATTCVDRGTLGNTIIEKGCVIDNNVQVGHNVHLEEGVVICGMSALAGSCHIEKFTVIAGLVGVSNKIRIGMGSQVAAFSAVFSNMPAGSVWGGAPARNWRDEVKSKVYIARLSELFAEKRKKNGNS
jgi:UDP-3-O-[3-hydroxymyristoyl] glucosamine N-acyltransferase